MEDEDTQILIVGGGLDDLSTSLLLSWRRALTAGGAPPGHVDPPRARGQNHRTMELLRLSARYLVAADGGRSPIRQRLGIGTYGRGSRSHCVSILFDADLAGPLRGRDFALCYLQNPGSTGAFVITDVAGRALVGVEYDLDQGERPEDFTEQRCAELVRAAVGVPDLEVAILTVLPCEMAARVADRFQDGRCSWLETRRMSCRRPARSGATPRCKTATTSPGGSPP